MRCSRCEHENPETNKFCGECGRALPRSAASGRPAYHTPQINENGRRHEAAEVTTQERPRLTAVEKPAAPLNGNGSNGDTDRVRAHPLLQENRAVHDPQILRSAGENVVPRTLSQMDVPVEPVREREVHQERQYEHSHDHAHDPNRITGPSFLGLSDPPAESEGTYLLEDVDTGSGTRRGLLFLALLAVVGFLVYKHWAVVSHAGAAMMASTHQNLPVQKIIRPGEAPPDAGDPADAAQSPKDALAEDQSQKKKEAETPAAKGADDKSSGETAGAGGAAKDSAKPAGADDNKLAENRTPEDAKPQSDRPTEDDAAAKNGGGKNGAKDAEDDSADVKPTASQAAAKKASHEDEALKQANAQIDLADKYLHGRGVAQDCAQGLQILNREAARSNARAAIQMGALYASGTCVRQDAVEAYRWFADALSKQPSNHWLERSMTSLWSSMSEDERKKAANER